MTIESESNNPILASSPCMLHELGADGAPQIDPQQASDVARWRKAELERLISTRMALGQPLAFREWHPHARLARGLWNIPYPADGTEMVPNIVAAPLVGFDCTCYRLGYGGGFFDRILACLSPKPMAIGVGYPGAALRTIFPQPHDVPMDWIVTGSAAPPRYGIWNRPMPHALCRRSVAALRRDAHSNHERT